jgi:uncharacterized protein YidB (DUF937 family)
MGLLDSILGKVAGGSSRGGSQDLLMQALVGLLGNTQSGGLSGIIDMLTKNGLGDIVSSWVSTGKNLPISPEQVLQGLGRDNVKNLASQAGVGTNDVTSMLAKILPQVVDNLTPQGKVPSQDMVAEGLTMLKGLKIL